MWKLNWFGGFEVGSKGGLDNIILVYWNLMMING